MTKAKLLPYINRFTGEIKTLTKKQGKKLNEDWSHAKMAKNEKGESVFRFELSSPVIGKDGVVHMGTAVVDLVEVEAEDGNGIAE